MSETAYPRSQITPEITPTRRALILHDSLTFLVLSLIAVVLFAVTWALFRSFETRREDLSKDWASRGREQLQHGQPDQAIVSLRAALTYTPDDYPTELLLAQALADAGQTDQATAYFLSMWTARPGDGFLNLQLARLARRTNDSKRAVPYYRASIYGDWRGDGVIKRRDVRLELVDYLASLHDSEGARAELLIAAGNAPDNVALNLLLADKLAAIGDGPDATAYYRRALTDAPRNVTALEAAGRFAFAQGDYGRARELLVRAEREAAGGVSDELRAMTRDAERLNELSLSRELPANERARHILVAAKIAQARLTACAPPDHDLQSRWQAAGTGAKRAALAASAEGQDTLTQLIFDTERQTGRSSIQSCGQPSGDDALLLKLAATQAREGAGNDE